MGIRFIWRCQIAELEFLSYVDLLDEPNISLGELGFPTLSNLGKFWIPASLTVKLSWNFYSNS